MESLAIRIVFVHVKLMLVCARGRYEAYQHIPGADIPSHPLTEVGKLLPASARVTPV